MPWADQPGSSGRETDDVASNEVRIGPERPAPNRSGSQRPSQPPIETRYVPKDSLTVSHSASRTEVDRPGSPLPAAPWNEVGTPFAFRNDWVGVSVRAVVRQIPILGVFPAIADLVDAQRVFNDKDASFAMKSCAGAKAVGAVATAVGMAALATVGVTLGSPVALVALPVAGALIAIGGDAGLTWLRRT